MKQTGYLIAVAPVAEREGEWLTRTYATGRVVWNVARRLANHYGDAAVITVIRFA